MLKVKTFQVTVHPSVLRNSNIFFNILLKSIVPVLMSSKQIGSAEVYERDEYEDRQERISFVHDIF